MPEPTPALVTLHLWGVPTASIPAALLSMGYDRTRLRRSPGLRFAKLLGTGDGRTFTVADADPHHWGLLAAWDSAAAADAIEGSPMIGAWDRRSTERLRITMIPIASKGRWAGRTPFGDPEPRPHHGPVAAITRARLRPAQAMAFWRAVPPVSAALQSSPGLDLALGIGEAPVGLQGTFSLWRTAADLDRFAYRDPDHREVIRRTHETGWYAEELFARFAVVSADGSFAGIRFGDAYAAGL
jgi:hypothetical protein